MEAWGEASMKTKDKKGFRQRSEIPLAAVKIGPTGERAKSDVFHTLSPVYHLSKVCGLLPVRLQVNKSGKYTGKLDVLQIMYGVLLLLACIGAQCWGLYRDLHNGWQNSTRLYSQSEVTVTVSDVVAVIIAVTVAILSSPCRWRHLQKALDKIVHVDEKLGIDTSKNLRRVSIIVMSVTFAYLVILSTVDFVWRMSTDTKHQQFSDKGPINYLPLCFMYIIIMAFEMQYALVLFNVGERFLKLNKTIDNLTRTNNVIEYFRKDIGLAALDPRKDLAQSLSFVSSDMGHNRLKRSNKVSDIIATAEGADKNESGGASEAIDQLITLHGILCDVVGDINHAYGGAILISTISCLIHLIITPYFFYNLVYSYSTAWYVLWLQVFWILFHVYRLLLFVQPCYMVVKKAKMTGKLVSEALANKWSPNAKKKLEIFSIQLLQRPVEFTACDLFYQDRGLVTSIVGAVTTYLVILVQFQTADDTKGTKNLLQNATELLKNASSYKNITTLKSIT